MAERSKTLHTATIWLYLIRLLKLCQIQGISAPYARPDLWLNTHRLQGGFIRCIFYVVKGIDYAHCIVGDKMGING